MVVVRGRVVEACLRTCNRHLPCLTPTHSLPLPSFLPAPFVSSKRSRFLGEITMVVAGSHLPTLTMKKKSWRQDRSSFKLAARDSDTGPLRCRRKGSSHQMMWHRQECNGGSSLSRTLVERIVRRDIDDLTSCEVGTVSTPTSIVHPSSSNKQCNCLQCKYRIGPSSPRIWIKNGWKYFDVYSTTRASSSDAVEENFVLFNGTYLTFWVSTTMQ